MERILSAIADKYCRETWLLDVAFWRAVMWPDEEEDDDDGIDPIVEFD